MQKLQGVKWTSSFNSLAVVVVFVGLMANDEENLTESRFWILFAGPIEYKELKMRENITIQKYYIQIKTNFLIDNK